MHDESEERMRAFRRTIDELKQSVGNIDAADVVAFKKRCDGLEARVLECEKNGRVSFGTLEHVNRELERLTLDFNDVRGDVAERLRRDEEVCKELERLEKRVKEEIVAATGTRNPSRKWKSNRFDWKTWRKSKAFARRCLGWKMERWPVKTRKRLKR